MKDDKVTNHNTIMDKEFRFRGPGNMPIIAPLAESNKDDKTQCKDVVHLIFRGEGVSLSLVDAHIVLCLPPEELCRGLVFNDYAPYSISIEVNGRKIQPVYKDINLSHKEFVAPKEWQTTKKLDWNRCVNKWQDGKFCCSIEVDGKFDEKMLRYNIAYPVSVRVGGKSYRYNRPILTSVDYKGANYSLVPYIRHTIDDWTLDGFEIPDIRNIRLNEPSL